MNKTTFASAIASGLLVACVELPDSETVGYEDGRLDVTAYDATLVDTKVNVYATDEQLQPTGEPLFTGRTDENGQVTVTALDLPDSVLYIRAGGAGHYVEEASGHSVYLQNSDYLTGLYRYKEGQSHLISVSGFTTIAAAFTQCVIAEFDQPANSALLETVEAWKGMYGIDMHNVVPINPTDNFQNLSNADGERYGLWAAGVSHFMASMAEAQGQPSHGIGYRSIDFYQAAVRDILEDGACALDGFIVVDNEQVSLGWGTYQLSTDSYRYEQALSTLGFIESDKNLSGTSVDEFDSAVQQLVQANHSRLFANTEPRSLDESAPEITLAYDDGQVVSGSLQYEVTVTDVSAIKRVELYLNDVLHAVLEDETLDFPVIDTTSFVDGALQVRVVATDVNDLSASAVHSLLVANTGPVLTILSDTVVNNTTYLLTALVESSNEIDLVTVNNESATATEESRYQISLLLSEGQNTITIEATDALGNRTETSTVVTVDSLEPSLVLSYSDNAYTVDYSPNSNRSNRDAGNISFGDTQPNPFYLTNNIVALNGIQPIIESLGNMRFLYLELKLTDASLSYASDIPVLDFEYSFNEGLVQNGTVAANSLVEDVATFVLPLTEESLGEFWYLLASSDEHTLKLSFTDIAGNSTEQRFTFETRYFMDEPEITTAVNESVFSGASLANMPAPGETATLATIEFENTETYPVWVNLDIFGAVDFEHEFLSGVRERQFQKAIDKYVEVKCKNDTEYIRMNDNVDVWYLNRPDGQQVYLDFPSSSTTGGTSVFNAAYVPPVYETSSYVDSSVPALVAPASEVFESGVGYIFGGLQMEGAYPVPCNVSQYVSQIDNGGMFGVTSSSDMRQVTRTTFLAVSDPVDNVSAENASYDVDALSLSYQINGGDIFNEGEEYFGTVLMPGDVLDVTVLMTFPELPLFGLVCEWDYTERMCDQRLTSFIMAFLAMNMSPEFMFGTNPEVEVDFDFDPLILEFERPDLF